MPKLVLGPLLRYVGETDATIWVETDAPCEVEVLGERARTFAVGSHHYALVQLTDLAPETTREYEVVLDGERRWPEPGSGFPPSVIRTPTRGERLTIAFGSCRVAVPHEPPHVRRKDDDPRGRELDALVALVGRMRGEPPEDWPDALLLLGDQVYADEVSPAIERRIAERRGPSSGPLTEVVDFEEYTWLYRESWSDPPIRWLLSTVPSAMIFDDHDVHDDWNTSEAWVEQMRAKPWWHERIVGAFMSYWIYQHLGNLGPEELSESELFRAVRERDDATDLLRDFAERADRDPEAARWSFCRDYGHTRLVVVDSRAGRVLSDGERAMVDRKEWRWIERHTEGEFDHLLIATSLPYLIAPAIHHLEAWNEAVCAGAWGGRAAALGERIRQLLDLEHWSAFHDSFAALTRLIERVGSGRVGRPPVTIVVLSGDVHHAYLAEVGFRAEAGVESAVLQAVCSPVRNPLGRRERAVMRVATSRPAAKLARLLARTAGAPPPPVGWRFVQDPTFDNQIGLLDLEGGSARIRIERTVAADWPVWRLHASLDREVVLGAGDRRRTRLVVPPPEPPGGSSAASPPRAGAP